MAMCPALYTGHESYMQKVKDVVEDLGKHADDFDGIIASGMSGLMIAAPVSLQLSKTLGVVRHTDDKRHPDDHAGLILIEKACFLDDFFGQGRTFRQCHDALQRAQSSDKITERDLTYYIGQYGDEWCRKNHPEWFAPEVVRSIVAIYTYDKMHPGEGGANRYMHVTSKFAPDLNKYRKLWPDDVFEALRSGKKPEKSAVKQVPVRDKAGRFAPKPAAPRIAMKYVQARSGAIPSRLGKGY